jgi:type IV secretory pathway VirB3-like protein
VNPVYNSINKRLLIFGVERGMFAAAMLAAVLVFYAFATFLGAAVVFACLFTAARLATKEDPRLPEVILAAAKMSRLYDSALR